MRNKVLDKLQKTASVGILGLASLGAGLSGQGCISVPESVDLYNMEEKPTWSNKYGFTGSEDASKIEYVEGNLNAWCQNHFEPMFWGIVSGDYDAFRRGW